MKHIYFRTREWIRSIPSPRHHLGMISLFVSLFVLVVCATSCAKSIEDSSTALNYYKLPTMSDDRSGFDHSRQLWVHRVSNPTSAELAEWETYNEVSYLEYLIVQDSSKKEKYEKKIEKIKAEYTANRINFLKQFYVDLYQKSPKDFTKKYKNCCSNNLRQFIKNYYSQAHEGENGYSWVLFGDNIKHDSLDIAITRSCYNEWTARADWFVVKLDTNTVSVQLTGAGKKIMISNVINRKYDVLGVKKDDYSYDYYD